MPRAYRHRRQEIRIRRRRARRALHQLMLAEEPFLLEDEEIEPFCDVVPRPHGPDRQVAFGGRDDRPDELS